MAHTNGFTILTEFRLGCCGEGGGKRLGTVGLSLSLRYPTTSIRKQTEAVRSVVKATAKFNKQKSSARM